MSVDSSRPFYADIVGETEGGVPVRFNEQMNKFIDEIVEKISTKQRQIDSSGGSPFGQLSGVIDGVNDVFTLTKGNVHSQSIACYIDGDLSDAFAETNLKDGVVTMDSPPTIGQQLIFIYETE